MRIMSVFIMATLIALAHSVTALADDASVRAAIESYVSAFNKRDLQALSQLWSEQGSHVDRETGARTEGREAILADIETAFEQNEQLRLNVRIDRVRPITDNVVSVSGQTSVSLDGAEPSLSSFSAILVRSESGWKIHSIEEMPVARPATAYDALKDLEWLVGRWVDESEDARVDTTIRWTPNRAFLLRSFVARNESGVTRQGSQVIGWDPRANNIRSWTFNSDGSFGDAIWSRNGKDWLIKSSQTLADGQAASGTFVLSPVDNDSLTLQLIGLEIEGEPQPTGPPVTVVRVEDGSLPAAQDPSAPQAIEPEPVTEPKGSNP